MGALVLGRAWLGYADAGDVVIDLLAALLPIIASLSIVVPDAGLRTARLVTGTTTAMFGATFTITYGLDFGAKDPILLSTQNVAALLLGTIATGTAAALADLRIADVEAAEADRRHQAVLAALPARDERPARRVRPVLVLAVVLVRALMRRRQIAVTPPGARAAR